MRNLDLKQNKPKPEPPKRSPYHPGSIAGEFAGLLGDMFNEASRIVKGAVRIAFYTVAGAGLLLASREDRNLKQEKEGLENDVS